MKQIYYGLVLVLNLVPSLTFAGTHIMFGDILPGAATSYIQNTSTLQSGSTAYPDFLYVGSTSVPLNASLATFNSFGFFPPGNGFHYFDDGNRAAPFGVFANTGIGAISLLSGTIGSGISSAASGSITLNENNGIGLTINGQAEKLFTNRFNQFGDLRSHLGWIYVWPDSTTIVSDSKEFVTVSTSGITMPGTGGLKVTYGITTATLTVSGISVFSSSMTVYGDFLVGAGGTTTFNNGAELAVRTKAQIAQITPRVAGALISCSDCTALTICISTGTGNGAWASPTAKTTACN